MTRPELQDHGKAAAMMGFAGTPRGQYAALCQACTQQAMLVLCCQAADAR